MSEADRDRLRAKEMLCKNNTQSSGRFDDANLARLKFSTKPIEFGASSGFQLVSIATHKSTSHLISFHFISPHLIISYTMQFSAKLSLVMLELADVFM